MTVVIIIPVFYIQRCSIFSNIGFALKITDVNSDVCKIHSDFTAEIICFISCVTNNYGYAPLFVDTSWSSLCSWLITMFVID